MRARELAAMLAVDCENVCQRLLPGGKRNGNFWRCGDVDGNAGQSLAVSLSGPAVGAWKDFATNAKGDLLDLWAITRRLSLRDAMREVSEHCGIRKPQFVHRAKPYQKPKIIADECNAKAESYLTNTRKLSPQAISAYKIQTSNNLIIFPHFRNGDVVAYKYMQTTGDKKNKWRWEKECEPCLFGWQAIPANARSVVICEGHMDAPSWWQMGYPALSIPNGVSSHEWIELDFELLEQFDKIYLSFDNDAPGVNAIANVAQRLGLTRCFVVSLPHGIKDGNELLNANRPTSEIDALISGAVTLDPEELKHASAYRDKTLAILSNHNAASDGYHTPWGKVGNEFRFRSGELTILAGENFHGKSQACGHFACEFIAQGAKLCVASLEYRPEKWLANIAKQAGAIGDSWTREYRDAVVNWVLEPTWVFDVSSAKTKTILDVFAYAHARYGINVYIIDNLQKCGLADDDYAGQKLFAESLSDFARNANVHVILVHHLKKSDDYQPRTISAVKGSGGITDMANNVVIWWRNRKKERGDASHNSDEAGNQPDAMMIVEKQRESGKTPKVALWFDANTGQFLPHKEAKPKRYVTWSAYDNVANG